MQHYIFIYHCKYSIRIDIFNITAKYMEYIVFILKVLVFLLELQYTYDFFFKKKTIKENEANVHSKLLDIKDVNDSKINCII